MAGNFSNQTQLKSYLDSQTLAEAKLLLLPPTLVPNGDTTQKIRWSCFQVSDFLAQQLQKKLERQDWQKTKPLLLGSWARGELCPKSDLDVLFLGDETIVSKAVSEILAQGIRLRSRLPQNAKDWSKGVEFQDLLSLFQAKSIDPLLTKELISQKQRIFTLAKKKQLVKKLIQERKERNRRFDSIANYLEPNMKYGTGGLRDLEQGLVVMELFPEIFKNSEHEKKVLEYYKAFFLTLRQKLHFSGFGDVLMSSEQIALSQWFGFTDHREFMRQIQRGISRVSFYSEWILERAISKTPKKDLVPQVQKPKKLAQLLIKNPSMQNQYLVRRHLEVTFRKEISYKEKRQILEMFFSKTTQDVSLVALFRSRLIDYLCPRIIRLVGYVQHDQYHRLTADAHILQALREVKRLFAKPKELEKLSFLKKDLQKSDLMILLWSALYHDLAKGMSTDHSEAGTDWVYEDLKKMGLKAQFIEEVAWIVQNHLVLSKAAFRKNPHDPKTWEELFDLGANASRIRRLAFFTAADIRATNIEAWNSWKSELLAKVVQQWLKQGTQNFLKVRENLVKKSQKFEIERLDLQLFEVFSTQLLLKDLWQTAQKKEESVRILKDKNNKTWVRFYTPKDQPKLLLRYLEILYSFGCSVQHALIHTIDGFGVYDWFQISTSKKPTQLKKWFKKTTNSISAPIPPVKFLEIDLVSQTPTEWVVSFRGTDQKGCLLAATSKISSLGCEILSARVHTWGRQIDDLFHIRPPMIKGDDFLRTLRDESL